MTTTACGSLSSASIRCSKKISPGAYGPRQFSLTDTILLLVLMLLVTAEAVAAQQPGPVFSETRIDWGTVFVGEPVEHSVTIQNSGDGALNIASVDLTPPLSVRAMPSGIPAGESRTIVVRLDTTNILGSYTGRAIVHFANAPDTELVLSAKVVGRIEVAPLPAFFVAGAPGKITEQSVDIINHETKPVKIYGADHPRDRFTTKIDTLEPGWHYRLTLSLNPSGSLGNHDDVILLRTSSQQTPTIAIEAHTILHGRVHTFPEALDIGVLRRSQIEGGASLALRSQILMIYQEGGKQFRLSIRSFPPYIFVTAEAGASGDRYQLSVSVIPEKLPLGVIDGKIVLSTNDPEFSEVSVPLNGTILP